MTEPRQPADHPAPDAAKPTPQGQAPNGVPPQADQAEPKGTPQSDRAKTENAAGDQ